MHELTKRIDARMDVPPIELDEIVTSYLKEKYFELSMVEESDNVKRIFKIHKILGLTEEKEDRCKHEVHGKDCFECFPTPQVKQREYTCEHIYIEYDSLWYRGDNDPQIHNWKACPECLQPISKPKELWEELAAVMYEAMSQRAKAEPGVHSKVLVEVEAQAALDFLREKGLLK